MAVRGRADERVTKRDRPVSYHEQSGCLGLGEGVGWKAERCQSPRDRSDIALAACRGEDECAPSEVREIADARAEAELEVNGDGKRLGQGAAAIELLRVESDSQFRQREGIPRRLTVEPSGHDRCD